MRLFSSRKKTVPKQGGATVPSTDGESPADLARVQREVKRLAHRKAREKRAAEKRAAKEAARREKEYHLKQRKRAKEQRKKAAAAKRLNRLKAKRQAMATKHEAARSPTPAASASQSTSASKSLFPWRKAGKVSKRKDEKTGGGEQVQGTTPAEEVKAAAKATKKRAETVTRMTRKQLKRKAKRKRRTASETRRVFSQLIVKAGHSIDPVKLRRIVFYLTFSIIVAVTVLTLLVASVFGKSALDLIVFYLGLWTGVFAFTYLFIWMVIYLYLDIRIYRRTRELEDVLPDFLQLASANISAGMPIDRALWFAVRPNFGVLAREIEEVAKATLAGEELSQSLITFTEKYDSVTLRRSISILLEGLDAGGEMADLLNKIALNIQDTMLQQKEMSANVATYAIFITFASIIMAPALFALATELLRIIVTITSTLDLSAASGSFLALHIQTTPQMITNFQWFSVTMLSISALMSGSIVSVIRRGRVREGLRNLPIFLVVSLTLYFLSRSALGVMLGNLI